MTTGWFTGLVPVTVEVTPDSFADTARSAQHSFDANVALADVPVERVLNRLRHWASPRPRRE